MMLRLGRGRSSHLVPRMAARSAIARNLPLAVRAERLALGASERSGGGAERLGRNRVHIGWHRGDTAWHARDDARNWKACINI